MSYAHGHPQGPYGFGAPGNKWHPEYNQQGGDDSAFWVAAAVITSPVWIFAFGIAALMTLMFLVALPLGGAILLGKGAVNAAESIGTVRWIGVLILLASAPVAVILVRHWARLRNAEASSDGRAFPVSGSAGYSPFAPAGLLQRRCVAWLMDLGMLAALAIAVFAPLYISMSTVDASGAIDCDAEVVFDRDGNRLDDGLCTNLDDGTVRYMPANKVGEFWVTTGSLTALFVVLHLVVLQGITGATLGKRLARLRVVRIDTSEPPGLLRAALRTLTLFTVDQCGLLGLLIARFTKRRQRIGDFLARTVVISAT